MDENLPQSQVPVNPVPPVQPSTPKRFSLKWILVAAFIVVVVFIGIFFVLISRQPSKVVNTNETVKIGEYKVLAKDGWEELEYLNTHEAKNTDDVYAVFSQLYPNYVDKKNEMYVKDIVVKGDTAEVYFGGDESWLTDRMGSTGPYNYSGLVTFALTEDSKIKKVDFKLKLAGTHFGPGIRNREDFIDLWPRKTYTNDLKKFTFQYPGNLDLKSDDFVTSLSIVLSPTPKGSEPVFSVTIMTKDYDKNYVGISRAEYEDSLKNASLNQVYQNTTTKRKFINSGKKVIDGKEFTIVKVQMISDVVDPRLPEEYRSEIVGIVGDDLYRFSPVETDLTDQILSTFKFCDGTCN